MAIYNAWARLDDRPGWPFAVPPQVEGSHMAKSPRWKAVCSAFLIVGACLAAPAVGQPAQTPENARTFISMLATNGQTKVKIPGNGGFNTFYLEVPCITSRYSKGPGCAAPTSRVAQAYPALGMNGAIFLSDCNLRIGIAKTLGAQWNEGLPESWQVDWTQIAAVEQAGASVTLVGNGAVFHFLNEALATRFAFAASFLRDHCDPTAGLGF